MTSLPSLAHLQTLLADCYALDAELRLTMAERGPTPELRRQQAHVRGDITDLLVAIDRAQNGARVYAAQLGRAA